MEKLPIVRFAPKGKNCFYDTVVTRVQEYFEKNNISPYANRGMYVKSGIMLALYFIPYIFMVLGYGGNHIWLFLCFWILMAVGMCGIGTAVMHDAIHGTYSGNKKVNNFISHILEIIGGYTVTWRIQHNK